MTDYNWQLRSTGIVDEIHRQSQGLETAGVFKCRACANWVGGCRCDKNVFIAFEGANLSGCDYFDQGKKCPHCGRLK